MAKFVLTAIGDDRPGLVSALSEVVSDHGGNWLESQMGRLGGKFAGIVLIEDSSDPAGLRERLAALGEDGLLDVTVTEAQDDGEPMGPMLAVHLLGHDRPGIVHEISAALASRGASIEELATSTGPAPMGDGILFEADALVRLADDGGAEAVREALEAVATELMVDLDVIDPFQM